MSRNRQSAGWLSVVMLPFIVILLVWAVAPALMTTEDATVYLEGCTEPVCALKGDLNVNIFTRHYELKQADGSIVSFDPENIALMSWPASKD
ncbi:hypothetical protein [Marinobacter nauticus]|uniref:Uncharacterized protein n=1 Tax=Marinobacter nauticus (strain ATCC 700491 / DSM 11845 / VT8) TaxID=351348 RepID=A1U852_MARN8|nr:hypothetical protein [Marinobacter nauticus]ABM21171.1 hypothetical protein Maqu_4320 [Marinobacter nauticus VT8]